MKWVLFGIVVGLGIMDWCFKSRLDATVRDPGKREVKPGTLKVLD